MSESTERELEIKTARAFLGTIPEMIAQFRADPGGEPGEAAVRYLKRLHRDVSAFLAAPDSPVRRGRAERSMREFNDLTQAAVRSARAPLN